MTILNQEPEGFKAWLDEANQWPIKSRDRQVESLIRELVAALEKVLPHGAYSEHGWSHEQKNAHALLTKFKNWK